MISKLRKATTPKLLLRMLIGLSLKITDMLSKNLNDRVQHSEESLATTVMIAILKGEIP